VKFIDETVITLQAGNGGAGCVSFRRERFIPRGGPDGGDGGKGGDIIIVATAKKRTFYHFQHKKLFKSQKGTYGQGSNKKGKDGQKLILEVPVGTIIRDADTEEVIKDLRCDGESFVLAAGGRGGQGNARFKTSKNRTPRFAQPGEPGEALTVKLDLKLLADVGIIGLPNAGKSTLISSISSAHPKIGNYPFTTLYPVLGVVQTGWGEPFIMADIPGLVEGAHKGVGLGIKFLKHIERTRILVHIIDAAAIDPDNPLSSYKTICNELAEYDTVLAKKSQIVVLNKLDLPGAPVNADIFREALENKTVVSISSATGAGIDELKSEIVQLLDKPDAK